MRHASQAGQSPTSAFAHDTCQPKWLRPLHQKAAPAAGRLRVLKYAQDRGLLVFSAHRKSARTAFLENLP